MRNIKWMVVLLAVLALAGLGCERKITGNVDVASNSSAGCFSCHSDQDIKLTVAREQYENSVHAAGENSNRNRLYDPRYQSCERCHTHEGFIAQVTGVAAAGDNFSPITCFTCHKPHTSGTLERRVTEAVVLEDGISIFDRGPANLCAFCHHSRANVMTYVVDSVEISERWGPHHSVQSDMLIGANAYEYADYKYSNSWHSTGVTEGCVECHMSKSQHESVGGHSWNMANEERHFENLSGCNQRGENGESVCHVSPALDSLNRVAYADYDGDGDITGIQTEVHNLLDSLQNLLLTAGLLEWSGVDSQYVPDSGRVVSAADSAGALYNWLFVKEDRSLGVHNTDYAVGLLKSSINFLEFGDPSPAPAAPRPKLFSAH
jgi:hypothetical protein